MKCDTAFTSAGREHIPEDRERFFRVVVRAPKEIFFYSESRSAFLAGIEKVADGVAVTEARRGNVNSFLVLFLSFSVMICSCCFAGF